MCLLLRFPVTQVLSTRIVAMKASLCKLSSSTIARVCDYHAKLFLIAISCTLKSLLRPHFLNTPDKSPGDRLTEICSKITDVGTDCSQHPSLPSQGLGLDRSLRCHSLIVTPGFEEEEKGDLRREGVRFGSISLSQAMSCFSSRH